jgi:curved DNA-binding protein CbpA
MAPDADPYRTLGLSRGATLDEVKRAYRRLAKINHPDAGGEKALPKFLAIQAAYEQLIGGAGSAKGRRAEAPRRPWEADPAQADATRRAYGGRARNPPPGSRGPRSDGAPGGPAKAPGGPAGAPGSPGEKGSSWAGSGPGGTTGRTGRRRTSEPRPSKADPAGEPGRGKKSRPSNKATFGSTSYDGADAGPFEPDWGGASWYGTTSGTYWTLNPKEYADPRKHGPEYQARARRSARADATARGAADAPDATGETLAADAMDPGVGPAASQTTGSATGPDARGPSADPTHTTTSWWDSTAGPAAGAADAGDPGRPRPTDGTERPSHDAEPAGQPDLGRVAAYIASALTDEGFGGTRARLVRAIIGWLPIALGLGWAVGELTGCGRFAATCDGSVEPMLLVLQVIVLGLLVLLPAAAPIATTAAVSLVVAAVIASLILSATGGAADGSSRQAALGLVLVIAWLIGLAFAIGRRARTLRSPIRPVS